MKDEQGGCLYVAPDGCDQWSGMLPERNDAGNDGPLATLDGAIGKARLGSCKKIIVKDGSYYDVSAELTEADSGLAIEGEPGKRPVLYGGRRIRGWKKEEDTPFWFAELPEVAQGLWDFRMLSAGNQFRTRSRLPEQGVFEHLTEFNVDWLSTTEGGWARKPTAEELTTLIYNPSDLGPWLDIKNAELTIYHKWDESMTGIASRDGQAHTFRLSNPCGHPPGAFQTHKYTVWNVREGMKQPGQWYLDRTAGRAVYWPEDGEDMETLEMIAPSAAAIINITGKVRDITLTGLKLSVTNTPLMAANFAAIRMPGAVQSLDGMENCRFDDLVIENTAGHGVKIEGCNSKVTIDGCKVNNTGAGGIVFYNNMIEMKDNNIEVVAFCNTETGNPEGVDCNISNSRITNAGLLSSSAIAIGTCYCNILGNEVANTTYTGISCGGGSARIEDNVVSKAMQVLNDGAAIYVTFCKNGSIRGNIIRDIRQSSDKDSTKNGIYLDEQTVNWVVEDNLVVNCTQPEFNHMAQHNIIRNNVFISDSELKMNFIRCGNYNVDGNIFYARGKVIFAGNEDAVSSFGNNTLFSELDQYEEQYINEKYQHYETVPFRFRDGSIIGKPELERIISKKSEMSGKITI